MNRKVMFWLLMTLISIIVGIFIYFYAETGTIRYNKNNISFKCNNGWHLSEKDNVITLNHEKSLGTITIITDKKQPSLNEFTNEQIANSVSYQIVENYDKYELVYSKLETDYNPKYVLYNYLYEAKDGTSQIEVLVGMTNNHVFSLVYENENSEFDLLLINFEDVVRSFNITD